MGEDRGGVGGNICLHIWAAVGRASRTAAAHLDGETGPAASAHLEQRGVRAPPEWGSHLGGTAGGEGRAHLGQQRPPGCSHLGADGGGPRALGRTSGGLRPQLGRQEQGGWGAHLESRAHLESQAARRHAHLEAQAGHWARRTSGQPGTSGVPGTSGEPGSPPARTSGEPSRTARGWRGSTNGRTSGRLRTSGPAQLCLAPRRIPPNWAGSRRRQSSRPGPGVSGGDGLFTRPSRRRAGRK